MNEPEISRRIFALEKKQSRDQTIDIPGNIGTASSLFKSIHGLVGFWPMNSIDASLVYDQSGQSRSLTKNGTPLTYELPSMTSYIDLNGTTQYLSRADEASLDITGALTIGGWFYFDALGTAAFEAVIGKFNDNAVNERSYLLYLNNVGGTVVFVISTNGSLGAGSSNDVATGALAISNWYFIVGRYTPSTELAVFVNGVKTVNTTAIVASAFNSNAQFEIGRRNKANTFMNGRASLCFLSMKALPDADIARLFNNSRTLFGV